MGDEGTCLGGAIISCIEAGEDINWLRKEHMPFFGAELPVFDLQELKSYLKLPCNLHEYDYKTGVSLLANYLAEDNIAVLIQGSSEFGPRALGHRSIIAAGTNKQAVKLINNRIKKRPEWQPFCPSILDTEQNRLFPSSYLNLHMSCSFKLDDNFREDLPSSCHVDGSSRKKVQFVTQSSNEYFYDVLRILKSITGYGVMLNTSFNRSGHVIPMNMKDIIDEFESMDIESIWILSGDKIYSIDKIKNVNDEIVVF